MFSNARLKLTGWYLLIIMLISVSFSIVIYRFLTSEINRALNMEKLHQQGAYYPAKKFIFFNNNDEVTRGIMITPPNTEVLEEAKQRILFLLIVINLGILGLSGVAGYLLAGLTLKPIKKMVDEQNRFITDASHELRTPLTSLRSEIEVNLRDKKLTVKDARKLLESNLEEVNNLQYLSDNLIKLAQTHTPNGIKFETVSFFDIATEAIRKVEKLAKKKNIDIEKSIEESLLLADRQGLTELLVILLDNAIKYSPENSSINLTSKKSGKNLKIEVKDQGIGIDKKDLPMLFKRFYRADSARSKKDADGFGLGLSIAKDIIEKHNGTIEVKSKPGVGTTFQIKIPKGS
jgi:two-component system, OmpR family, sensor histidine kinase CiaH